MTMTTIEFYEGRGARSPFCTVRSAGAVPRQGEYISIQQETWRVERVTWAVDSEPAQLRANIDLKRAARPNI